MVDFMVVIANLKKYFRVIGKDLLFFSDFTQVPLILLDCFCQ